MRELGSDVFVEDRYSTIEDYHGCNYGFVSTSEGPVVVDTPEWPSDAVAFRDRLDDRGETQFLINTHEHLDHVAGNYYLSGPTVSHERVRDAITGDPVPESAKTMVDHLFDESIARDKRKAIDDMEDGTLSWETYLRLLFDDLDPESLQHLDGYRMDPPNVTFTEDATIHVGDCTFRLLHLPGHTESHICVYVPEKKVLFTGDNVTTGCYPSMSLSRPADWIESVRTLESLDVEYVVSGHGEVGGAEELPAFRSFLETAVERVRRAIDDGVSRTDAVGELSFADLRPPLHPTDESHRHDVERLYDVLS